MNPHFFATKEDFRAWMEKNHNSAAELLVGFFKVGSGKASITWDESVDVALCFGWIDGIRKSIDGQSYSIRFTPRRPGSNWSRKNINRTEELKKQGLMHEAGLAAYEKRKIDKQNPYSFEMEERVLPPEYEQEFRSDAPAWDFFNRQAPSYRKAVIHYILSAKAEETRLARLQKTIERCRESRRL